MSFLIRLHARKTRHELFLLKERLELAKKAHKLLEEKYRILMKETQHIRRTVIPFQKELTSKLENAYGLLSATILSIGLKNVYKASLATVANDEVEIRWTTIRGVSAPRLDSKIRRRTPLTRGYGIKGTNYFLDRAAEAFEDSIMSIIRVAELENSYRILEREVKKTRIRVSALEKVLIPSLEAEIKNIKSKLEKNEIENHVLVKWVRERVNREL
jgi:V/A-type H+-transporting ATPase subunit D